MECSSGQGCGKDNSDTLLCYSLPTTDSFYFLCSHHSSFSPCTHPILLEECSTSLTVMSHKQLISYYDQLSCSFFVSVISDDRIKQKVHNTLSQHKQLCCYAVVAAAPAAMVLLFLDCRKEWHLQINPKVN